MAFFCTDNPAETVEEVRQLEHKLAQARELLDEQLALREEASRQAERIGMTSMTDWEFRALKQACAIEEERRNEDAEG